jgi:hypothetical protein
MLRIFGLAFALLLAVVPVAPARADSPLPVDPNAHVIIAEATE